MRTFLIGEQTYDETSPELRALLPQAYEQQIRPMCMCKEPAVAMYIARLDDQFVVKRMPLSGRAHDPVCPSYAPPYELSGLGPLIGNAIQIEASGKADLKLDFSLTKRGPRTAAAAPTEAPESGIRSEPRRLSLKAMLHYLWDAGELTEWRAAWAGRRGWGRIRASLLNAASQMSARGSPFSDMLFVPEVFQSNDKDGIAARRAAALKGVQATGSGSRKLMVIVAEVKEFSRAREGQKIVVRHMPFPLMIEEGAWRRLTARYNTELELWRSSEAFHLIAIATFGISAAGIAAVEEVALMVVTEHWLPFEDIHELRLLKKLGHLNRKTVKGLRFNLPRSAPTVSVMLPEQKPAPVAMFIVPPNADEKYERALADLIETRSEITSWIWRVAEGEIPKLP